MSHFHIPTYYRKPSMEVEEGCCKSYVIAFAQNCTNKNNACGHHFAMTTSV